MDTHARKHILLIEDDQDYVQLVSVALAEDTFEVRSAASVAASLALIEEFRPDVILMDLNLPDSSGLETFLRVRERAQGIPIVVLTSMDDDRTAIKAVEDGAQDYLVKSSFQPKLLARCMNMALTRQRTQGAPTPDAPGLPGSVLSFIGSKGGVGTSTTALNVAALLARNGFETLLIELQQGCSGTLSIYLETETGQDLSCLLRNPANGITAADFEHCLAPAVAGLRLLCLPASPGAGVALDADRAQAIITAARGAYPLVVLDLPPRIDEGVARALELSDSVTLIADREAASLHCGAAMAQQIRQVASGTKATNLALVHRTTLDSPIPLAEIQAQLKMHPLATIPFAAPSIALAHSVRTPLALLYPDDPFSVAHLELAKSLLASTPAGKRRSLGSLGTLLERESVWPTIPETTYS
jgi:DNA-binding response OmpR family regulator